MALTAVERTNIVKLTVALYNAAPGASGLSDFTTFYEANGRNLNTLALNLTNNNIFKSLNPNTQIASEFATSVLSVYGLQNNTDAIAFVTSRFNSGVSKGQIAFESALAVNNTTSTTGDFANARAILNNKTIVAEDYSVTLSGQSVSIGDLKAVVTNVTADPASVNVVKLANFTAASQSLILTVGQDNLSGTALDDIFTSNVVQNSLGQQVNTLGSGDLLKGGAGNDTLNAKITAGAYVADAPPMPIQPETNSIELIKLQAVRSGITLGNATDTQVYVNARSMLGVNKIASNYSDADLVVLNLTTLDNAGVARPVSALTVGMEYTGNADSRFGASDLSVFFDQDYLTASSTSSSSIEIRIVDNVELKTKNLPLTAFEAVSFSVGGQLVVVDVTPINRALTGTAAYNELVNAINARLTTLNITNVTVTAQPQRDSIFSDDVSGFAQGTLAGNYTPILVKSTAAPLTLGQAKLAATTLNFNGLNTQVPASASQAQLIAINVDLEKAGLAGDGGNLIIGSMNKTSTNVFNATETNTPTKSGIEQFNLSVKGDNTKSSSLASLQSTNNNLKIVTVTTDAAFATGTTFAGLKIGNTRTGSEISGIRQADAIGLKVSDLPSANNQNALKDVQTFDATGFKGDLTLFAGITTESVAKYMTLTDGAPTGLPTAPAADNVNFVYTGGSGKNIINLNIASDNLSAPGTTTREDFKLVINGGGAAGNQISTQIGDGTIPTGPNSNWYANSKINANLTINSGEGADTVRTFGSGDFIINAGAGNDTIYADNSGTQKAVYVFNAFDGDPVTPGVQLNVANLLSQPAATVQAVNANLTVTFKGFNAVPVNISGSTSAGANVSSSNALANVTISDLNVNQAIKASINSDPVLSKLLIAQDGPGRTLVVTSLIDGANVSGDLGIAFGGAALSAAQIAAVSPTNTLVTFGNAAAANLTLLDGYGGFNGGANNPAPFATDAANNNVTGRNSTAIADNIITPGTGDDVVVLATGVSSNDMVNYSGLGNGRDTVVNFSTSSTAAGGQDYLNFKGYGVNGVLTGTGGINGAIVIGTLDPTKVGTYINLVESATNPGEYAINYVDLGATSALTDNIVGQNIATVDFGATQVFTASNLLLNANTVPGSAPVVVVPPVAGFVNVPVVATGNTATPVAENFTVDVATAIADVAGTNFQSILNGFTATGATADRLTIDLPIANAAITTLAQLNGQQGVTVQPNPFTNSTLINFGPDANGGQLVTITLTGIIDATTVAVSII